MPNDDYQFEDFSIPDEYFTSEDEYYDAYDDYDTDYEDTYYKKKGGRAKRVITSLLILILLIGGGLFSFMTFFARPPGGDIVTILIAGQDNVGEHGLSDTIMLVSLDVSSGRTSVVSIPRDTKVDESWAIPKINSVYAMTGGSAGRLLSAAEAITGFVVDGYVILDMQAFTALVDAIGGVYFDVPRDMRYDDPCQNLHINLQAGYQHLDGEQALHLIRWRQNNDGTGFANGDLGRIGTQQDFMGALTAELFQLRNVTRVGSVTRIFSAYVETNLHLGNLMWLAQQFMRMDNEDIRFLMIPNYAANIGGVWYQVIQLDPWLGMINAHLSPASLEIREENLRVWAWKDGSVQRTGAGLTLTP